MNRPPARLASELILSPGLSVHYFYVFHLNDVEYIPKYHFCLSQNECPEDMGVHANGILLRAEGLIPAG